VEHHALLYRDLADPLALLRGELRGEQGGEQRGALAGYWPYAGSQRPAALQADAVAPYSALMAASQPWVAQQLFDAYPLRRHRRLLDVGGGEAAFARLALARAPQLQALVFDLPAVVERARQRGLPARCQVQGGDFLREPLPAGHDLITLVRVLHDHDDAAVLTLLRATRAALAPGGRLLVLEPLRDGGAAMADAYFGLYLWAMGSGRARSAAELTVLLHQAGFRQVRQRPTAMPLLAGLLEISV
jgi:demethylspheroidene O-methyltransferase